MIDKIVRATIEHARDMAPRMRQMEVDEIMSSHGMKPLECLSVGVSDSVLSWAWIIDGRVGCMFGITRLNMLDNDCYAWLLSSDLVDKYPRLFARRCKELLPELLFYNGKLIGHVDSRYDLSIRWLKWMGAKIDDAEPFGVQGLPFHRFTLGG
jgi:hypothetical protein